MQQQSNEIFLRIPRKENTALNYLTVEKCLHHEYTQTPVRENIRKSSEIKYSAKFYEVLIEIHADVTAVTYGRFFIAGNSCANTSKCFVTIQKIFKELRC